MRSRFPRACTFRTAKPVLGIVERYALDRPCEGFGHFGLGIGKSVTHRVLMWCTGEFFQRLGFKIQLECEFMESCGSRQPFRQVCL